MVKLVSIAGLALALPAASLAAPFCLTIPNGTPQCIYYDGASCAREAGRQNGSCQVNPAEITLPASRGGEYCLILPGGSARCGYADGTMCARDAVLQKGACALSAGATRQELPDAYAPNAGR